MKLQSITTILLILGIAFAASAQTRQTNDTTGYRSIIPTEKQGLLKNVDVIANIQMGIRNDFEDGEFIGTRFKFEQFRLELKGHVHEKIYFRFRHRYTSTFTPQSVDKIIKGVDLAYMQFTLSKKLKLTVGKTFADWGGVEFDLNPINVFEYSDIIEQADNFLTGVGLYYQVHKNHGLSFQVLNSRTGTFEELYDSIPTVTASKVPLAGVVNWRGRFGKKGRFTTMWSYSIFTEAKDNFFQYVALGNQLALKKVTIMYDFKISIEDLDRTGIISNDVPDEIFNFALPDAMYLSHWMRVDYRFVPQWQLSLVGFVDQAFWRGDQDPNKNTNNWRVVYSFAPSLEYFPFKQFDLKFYLGYVARFYNYSDYASAGLGVDRFDTGRAIFGVITPLKIL